ncbi:hypothetical protein Kpol_1023p27 [Vanderwaltozyma polyspora DSM 70294]|uniref:chitin synthase n=1 Tax=Vanderwaltozyma polyspora (strain ATCC 22028 / DSM 70294 / BCRC 21397 / CBS 2163 / NBRC 10782 / NRRL Y-8283 / UCD 57-17) TaxID=436907 RepID=A7TFQ0_VANPO|nr:uncharacterized protein Kpol_1023p27 [Vanderwaltozyma polyspora DSM 70294]EDO18858.1 hypothetical protein Kpol_1023p27 [Vanderwaltozyma polyspora DSM 70294]
MSSFAGNNFGNDNDRNGRNRDQEDDRNRSYNMRPTPSDYYAENSNQDQQHDHHYQYQQNNSDTFVPTPPLQLSTNNNNEQSNVYESFVNSKQSQSTMATGNTYNNVFVNNSNYEGQQQQYHPQNAMPSISVTHAPSPVIPNSSQIFSESNLQYQDNQHYYNNNTLNSYLHGSGSSNSINSIVDEYSNVMDYNRQDTVPIINNNKNDYNHSYNQNYAQNDLDPENYYIDHGGDDYQINTYLGRDGEMVDPYSLNPEMREILLSPYQKHYMAAEEESDIEREKDYSNIANKYSHVNLGEYGVVEDSNTIDENNSTSNEMSRITTTTSSTASSNDRLVNDEDNSDNLLRRNTTVLRKFKLSNGNFVFDSPISRSLVSKYTSAAGNEGNVSNEFKFMRYQAVTCEPNQMAQENFTVRQLKYFTPRYTELMIVITMYNEDHILLGRTLKGVMDNIKHMVRKTHSKTWGPDAWKKIVVCIVSDGRSKINEKALALMSSLGCYQDGFAKDEVNEKKVAMHVYEHTTMMNITNVTESEIELDCNQSTVPVQLLFCLKEQNKKKINSHRWALEGFAELLQPNIVTLLDAGTMPGKDSIYELWREFRDPQVGGACGEIKTDIGKFGKKLINPLVASQNFEYKMSNILDKTTESNFGFITVLPGAFSAYRFEAVKGQPLEKYFYGEHMEGDETNLHFFSSNMYLAEDRILCFEIVTKKNCNWILKYCRSSSASTDVPERVPEFILQRRRWLNGSFFAGIYSFCHFYKVWTSGHSVVRKFFLTIEFLYLFFNTILSWFSLSSFFLVFRILTLSIAISYHSALNILSVVFFWLYGVCILSTFILSLGNKPKSTEMFYVITCIFFAVLMAYMIFCSIFLSVKSFQTILNEKTTFLGVITTRTFRDIIISLGSTYGLYLISSIIYMQPWHMLTSFIQYLLLSPSYINVLNIYAFCNVHDLSWGTKGAVAKPLGKISTKEDGTFKMEILVSSEEIQADYNKQLAILKAPIEEEEESQPSIEERKTGYYANIRSLVIIFWVLTNFGVIAAVLETGGIQEYLALKSLSGTTTDDNTKAPFPILPVNATWYLAIILWLVALLAFVRFVGCTWYMITRILRRLFRW